MGYLVVRGVRYSDRQPYAPQLMLAAWWALVQALVSDPPHPLRPRSLHPSRRHPPPWICCAQPWRCVPETMSTEVAPWTSRNGPPHPLRPGRSSVPLASFHPIDHSAMAMSRREGKDRIMTCGPIFQGHFRFLAMKPSVSGARAGLCAK